ncbi:MAG TPA: hypothetical protein VE783_13395, partial [Candidatus Limnocylindrales bacterium]|nr:hypothetical protein [Candidatus Limnocylindrales bacterium]
MKAAIVPLRSLILLLAFPAFASLAHGQSQPAPAHETSSPSPSAQSDRADSVPTRKIKIAGIYFFGYEKDGIDLSPIRTALPVHEGDELLIDGIPSLRSKTSEAVQKVEGNPPTDTAAVC